MPPWIRTIVMAIARIAMNTDWLRTLKTLFDVRNVEFCVAMIALMTIRNTSVPPPALVAIRRGSPRAWSSTVACNDMSGPFLATRRDAHVRHRRPGVQWHVHAQAGQGEVSHRAVEDHGPDDAEADDHLEPGGVDLLDLDADVDGTEEQRAERRPRDAATAACEAGPGEHRRRDRLQLEALSEPRWHGRQSRCQHDAGHRGQDARKGEYGYPHPVHVQTRQVRRLAIDPDREDDSAEARATQHQLERDHDDGRDDDRERDREDLVVRQRGERRRGEAVQRPRGRDQDERTAGDAERRQRDDEITDLQFGDEEAVQQAEAEADRERGEHRQGEAA